MAAVLCGTQPLLDHHDRLLRRMSAFFTVECCVLIKSLPCLVCGLQEVSAALLSMPSLSELWLCGVRFSSLTGLNTCLCR